MFYHARKSLIKEESLSEKVPSNPIFHQIVKPAKVSDLTMTLPNGIRIGLDGLSMEDLSRLLVNMGRHA